MSITTPVGNASRLDDKYIVLYSTGASMNNLPASSAAIVTGSVFGPMGTYRKSVCVYVASGASASLGTTTTYIYVDWSVDNVKWHGANVSGAGTLINNSLRSDIQTMGVWNQFPIDFTMPYMRILIDNRTGSAISGSIYVIGYKAS